ncbi:ABC transporter ATP-binding protein [Marinifilum caeruleilacunae]|uniref:ATP-binding cassette domain-containing protein n=1 Tax=Marinifilum caeruleilacunae TaxID=2499076 RepID=A0ABX1WVI2_9BACT|nr:ATP-binding cassette domain-containing protein [Marinifilum caeruleilacunae]NOU59918.1 ATP-binding cassette domain-containing protein [Marinifilum caeruleilacunae]
MALIKTEALSYQYPGGKILNFPALQIGINESWLLTGNSGSGKTTLLHLISGILMPSSGTLQIANTLLNNLRPAEIDVYRAKNIGMVFQKSYFIDALSMHKNLLYFAELSGKKADIEFVNKLLNDLGIANLARKKPTTLSSGELQRFSIARALINKPGIILADEPTSSLDDDNCKRFIELIIGICKSYGVTLVVATHDARLKKEFVNTIQLN